MMGTKRRVSGGMEAFFADGAGAAIYTIVFAGKLNMWKIESVKEK